MPMGGFTLVGEEQKKYDGTWSLKEKETKKKGKKKLCGQATENCMRFKASKEINIGKGERGGGKRRYVPCSCRKGKNCDHCVRQAVIEGGEEPP